LVSTSSAKAASFFSAHSPSALRSTSSTLAAGTGGSTRGGAAAVTGARACVQGLRSTTPSNSPQKRPWCS
jgi:hypothetical protein